MVSLSGTLRGIKGYFFSKDIAGQALAQLPRIGIGMVSTELGNRLITASIGTIGSIANEKWMKNPLLRSFFANMMLSPIGDPTASQLRELKRNWRDLVGGMKAHSFKTAFGALMEEPHEVVGAIKGILPKFSLKSLGSFKDKFMSSDKMIKAIDTSAVTTYTDKFAGALDEDDIVTY